MLMHSGNDEHRCTEILNWAMQPAGPQIDELEKAIVENEAISESIAAECKVELEAARRTGYRIPR
jgi:hypothetical protein